MQYTIDITSPKVKYAMKALSITQEDLEIK